MQLSGQEMVMLVTVVVGDREKERFLNICLSPGGSNRMSWGKPLLHSLTPAGSSVVSLLPQDLTL